VFDMTALSICTASSNGVGMPLEGINPEFIDDADPPQAVPSFIKQEVRRAVVQKGSVLLIDDRILARECLRSSLVSRHAPWEVVAYSSMEEWQKKADRHPPLAAVLLHVGSDKIADPHMEEHIKQLIKASGSAPLIILADRDDVVQMLNAFEYGVRGYIPSSVSVEVCVEAINLALAGGVFVPASTVFATREMINASSSHDRRLTEMFTSRQIQVAKAIWEGKPNKIIAYELNMCESTVKVHTRTIMQKLKATNRTEAAYKVSNLFASNGISL
jgi:DNA-binding NarL/FixJ family response regulator